jgi:hypothetical protein
MMRGSKFDLSREMMDDDTIVNHLKDISIATDFYRALCNMRWKKITALDKQEQIIDKLKGIDSLIWSCSWRSSGGIIADIRNKHYNTTEDYMDYYCAGQEGEISPLVERCFNDIGWVQCPWPDNN